MFEDTLEKQYPWLISKYEAWDKDGNEEIRSFSPIYGIPNGWLYSFGELLFGDLDEIITRDNLTNFRFDEAKEKYGALRIYSSGGNDETEKIIENYSVLSENICMICGKPDVYMTTRGWIFPCCESCWGKRMNVNLDYEDAVDGNEEMADHRKSVRYEDDKKIETIYDLKPLRNRIRIYWNQKGKQISENELLDK